MNNEPVYIIGHCTDVSRKRAPRQFRAVNNFHRDVRHFPKSSLGYYGGYHFFYEPDGTEFRYKEDWEIGAHCNTVVDGKSINLQSIALCWAGDGDMEFPTEKQAVMMAIRTKKLQMKYNIPKTNIRIAPHRHWRPSKTCYGSLLANDWFLRNAFPINQKDPEQIEKQLTIPALENQYRDLLMQYVLLLKILVNKLMNRGRTKVGPQ